MPLLMASCSSLLISKRTILSIFLLLASTHGIKGCFTRIFSFGDSLTDTGNLLNIWQGDEPALFGLPPYGDTYFHRPTGRCSDGRVVIDFIAESLGLSHIPPYIGGNKEKLTNIVDGVNFAVVAATVLNATYYIEKGIDKPFASFSLKTQLGWFKEVLHSTCNTSPGIGIETYGFQSGWFKEVLHSACATSSDCKEFLRSSLFLVGSIGSNDYVEALRSGGGLEEAKSFVPTVIEAISNSLIELIELGATSLIVPGCFPFGCMPGFLTIVKTSSKEEYDPSTGCLKWLNTFTKYHNELLQMELERLRKLYPDLNIVYADYYNAAMRLHNFPTQYGFSRPHEACCGGDGPYHYNESIQCGMGEATACDDPSSYISWDGHHMTEAAYKWIAEGLLRGPYSIPLFNASCLSSDVKHEM